ncbi:Fic family protein [Chitinophaga solisilvae]|uniref:Fic family protein n=1 Tax=Chitinophaga solisilvae TaxID=1233460 RepID=A0A433WCI8_9BACT|nr:Fic family protein [Chitinophaga solisilvae]NSL89995.1 Fic family protein [Chitinophaga solisilvae]
MRIPEGPPITPKDFVYAEVLSQLSEKKKFQEFLDINDNKYYYWEKWKYLADDWKIDAKRLWAAVKTWRISNKRLSISSLPKFKFLVGSPSVVQQALHAFDMNLGGSLQGDSIIPSEDRDRYLISSLMEEAIASSQLEGAATTRKVAKEMLENNRKPRNTSEQMILNNYEAMKWIVENKSMDITKDAILQIHAILTKNTFSERSEEGVIRKSDDINVVDVQTGKSVYTPPPADQLEQLMDDFCHFANDREKLSFFMHPITKGIILHFLMGYIHPFADGNGRTARTIFYWYLIKKGYWLIEYMSVSRTILNSKAQYAHAYLHTELDDNDLTYFIIYNLRSINIAMEDLKSYIQRKTAEKQNIITLLRNTSFNDRQIGLIQEILKDVTIYFTVAQVQNKFGVSNQTARNDLGGLVENGVLEERRSGRKSQFLPLPAYIRKLQKAQK